MANILVVEGYPPSLSALTAALALGNHRVVEAKDGVEALAKARAEHFDLVISDILLPRMDGFEFVRQMRNIPASALTPVIFTMATYDQAEARPLSTACGVKYFLPRPSTSEETLEAVATALSEPPPAATEAGRSPNESTRSCLRRSWTRGWRNWKPFAQAPSRGPSWSWRTTPWTSTSCSKP